ncbi:hypothetical protein [Bradyrhizobium arachidis]|uniref:hypothetical protein n=1 Tax=Bradyrhizobium arachidis TaxID=858423 RepID=UPI002161C8A5|nr:hypothetical protein [Bradyrhizobium arachidis]UVO28384.1 hypothetical protein KUF59_39005 [Bradyrhizobium arachidis]
MLKYLTKISMDIFPSVLATIIGAYIVNHYINARPAPDTPAAAVAPAQTKKDGKPTDVANLPGPGIKAKGISEKSVTDKPVADKAPADKPAAEKAAADKPAVDKPAEKAADQPAEAKAADETPAAPRGRQPAAKTVTKSSPASSPAPVVSAPAAAAPAVEANAATAATPANQDANDLARAAIERLRKSPEAKSPEAKSPEAKSPEKPIEAAPQAVRPLPPPITVSTPASEPYASSPANPPYTASVGSDDANRLTPPADIPVPVLAPPLDLRADAAGSMPNPMSKPKTNVADEMLSGVKSMFNAVLPKNVTPN